MYQHRLIGSPSAAATPPQMPWEVVLLVFTTLLAAWMFAVGL